MNGKHLKRILAAVASVAALGVVGTAAATPGLPSSRFDPKETSWVSLRDYSSAAFAAKFDELKSTMMVIDLDVDVIGGDYRVGAVFRKNPDGRGWVSLRDLSGTAFAAKWDELKAKGFRPVDQESYVVGGKRLFAGVWIENREHLGFASYRGVDSAAFSAKFDHYRDLGLMPVDVDVYPTGDGLRYAAVWVENSEHLGWKLKRGLTSTQFASNFDTYKAQGFRSLVVDSVRTSEGQRYAGIFVENRNKRAWYEYRDLTATGFRNRWNQLADLGYRLDGYEKYETASGARFSGVWRQNSTRPDFKLRTTIDGFVQKHLDLYKVPGVSVSIAYQGQTVYQRGFGYQDVADGIWMHGNSVGRLASISKAVAGVLAMRMEAEHPGFLAKKVRTYLPSMPSFHDYTVAQTVMNRSCVKSYPSPMTDQNQTQYDTAWLAVKAFMAQSLGCTPGSYLYSTHGYTVFSAVLELLEGKTIDRIVLDELTNRFGLTTLRPETTAGSLDDRVQLYNTDNSEYAGDNESNKTLGGGLVASASDLTRFGVEVLDGTILSAAQRTTMWTPIGSYGYGWDVGTADSGERVVGKAGGQPGANTHLRIYPDDGIVISVLTNRWKGGHSAPTLSRQIGELMLNELP